VAASLAGGKAPQKRWAMRRTPAFISACALLEVTGHAAADTPAFDRPGISFSTSTIPRDTFALEMGIMDFVHAVDAGTTITLYSLNTNIRAGLSNNFELQLAAPVWNYHSTQSTGNSGSASGLGDTSLSLKAALPSGSESFSWSALAGITFQTGEGPFTAGSPQYRVAMAFGGKLNDAYTSGFYVNVINFNGRTGYALSPNLNLVLSNRLSVYGEVGYKHYALTPDITVAGGGLAWMVSPTMQLDVSMDFGLTGRSPDYQGGFGVSKFFR
jgi:Putative MetA-pathway of phenol degradation